ncbi:hypothetical protein OG819_01225 [Streptomyces sp. NBC_01549]|uniref:hypothetical protein n=1 Tax=Streptomyces sp. NBC_01549 TaxID=2975874 RepID=UPI002252D950|nr:hypothetical protein [Streptomyces sp. NBC_01549]MCX4588408.1 hypothetical protein [Streptomyces sp. NBC_01549]
MEITPVMATLLGAGFGSLSTALIAVVVQKATLKRERKHKLWERQVAVIEESLRHERVVALKRNEVMRNPGPETDVFLALKSVFDEADVSKIMANLELYGSPAIQAAHRTAFEAWRDWLVDFVDWQKWNKRTGPGHEEEKERAEAVRETTKRWPNVEKLASKADEAYDELVRVMRATAIFEPVTNRVNPPNPELPR